MLIRHPVKTALGLVLAIAILTAPGVASAQSLFGAPAPDASSTPASSAPPAASAAAPAAAKKPVAKRMPRKPAVPKAAAKVTIINNRDATLVELSVTSTTARNAKPQVVAHDLKSGQKVSAPLAKNGGCIYEVSGDFDDQSTVEQAAVDFCKDANLNLVE
jgi:hypothetical protein